MHATRWLLISALALLGCAAGASAPSGSGDGDGLSLDGIHGAAGDGDGDRDGSTAGDDSNDVPGGSTAGSGATGDAGAASDDGSDDTTEVDGGQDAGADAAMTDVDAGPIDECPQTQGVPGSSPTPTHKVKNLTGSGTSAAQFGVGGTSLGIPVRQPDGQIAYIFGNTYDGDTVGGTGWRSPVLLRSAGGMPSSGIVFTGAAGGSTAKQILTYGHTNDTTWLPSDAITIGDRMYLHFVANQGLGNVQYTQIAYSDDNGENWTISSAARWEATEDDSLRQLWTWERGCDGYVYILSTKFISRDRAIILYRVPEDSLLDPSAYEPFGYANGQWAWGQPASVVLDGQFGEMSLRRVEDKWVLAWFNAKDYEITIKVFDSLTSNLYTADTYHPIQGGDWGAENDTTVAQLFGGYIHPDSTLHELHLVVSQWNTSSNWPYRAMQFVTGVE